MFDTLPSPQRMAAKSSFSSSSATSSSSTLVVTFAEIFDRVSISDMTLTLDRAHSTNSS